MQYTPQGAILNAAAATRTVECPLLKDYAADADGFDDLEARIYVPSGGSVSCTAYSYDPDGTYNDSSAVASSGSGVQTLDWSATLDGVADGYYYLRCTLSYGSKILGIWANENST